MIAPQLVEGLSEMLWDFGFRHHPDLQTKWIEGSAGLGGVARMVESPPSSDEFTEAAESFLEANNPDLLRRIRNGSPEEKAALMKDLEANFSRLSEALKSLKED